MKPVWEQVKAATVGSGIIYSEVDQDAKKVAGVNGVPTIIMIDENGHASKYNGGPVFEHLRNWIVAPH